MSGITECSAEAFSRLNARYEGGLRTGLGEQKEWWMVTRGTVEDVEMVVEEESDFACQVTRHLWLRLWSHMEYMEEVAKNENGTVSKVRI